jgi:hypothetical protein
MASLRKRGKVWYYRYVDADGVKRTVRGCSDRRASEELARDAEAQAAKMRAGLVDAKDLARRDHQARPVSAHLTAWGNPLRTRAGRPSILSFRSAEPAGLWPSSWVPNYWTSTLPTTRSDPSLPATKRPWPGVWSRPGCPT